MFFNPGAVWAVLKTLLRHSWRQYWALWVIALLVLLGLGIGYFINRGM